jgi:excisionase family DNA binding protein
MSIIIVESMKLRLLSMSEVAALIGCSKPTLRLMVRDGSLPVIRIGRRLKVDELKLTEWLDRGGAFLSITSRGRNNNE